MAGAQLVAIDATLARDRCAPNGRPQAVRPPRAL